MRIRTDRWTTREDAKTDSRYLHPQVKKQTAAHIEAEDSVYIKIANV